ncbi:MAG: DUF1080 domain-containing protein [Pirellulales bacterium]|nr:DUF1080 domain-containing protein [Pirellulales bacterium]
MAGNPQIPQPHLRPRADALTGYLRNISITILCSLPCLHAASGSDSVSLNRLSKAEKRAGWQLLFDGSTTDGWRNFRQKSLSDRWRVEDGTLVRAHDGAGDIITDDQFENFELTLEYKISPGGNSGLMFHVTEQESAPWMTGPEIQILDNEHGQDPQLTGWLYGLYQPKKPKWVLLEEQASRLLTPTIPDSSRPAGEWNRIYLRIGPEQGELLLNGLRYYSFKKGSPDWNKRVAESKFAAYPHFGNARRGHIALQDHGDRVAFRNIKIRPFRDEADIHNPIDGRIDVDRIPAFSQLEFEDLDGETAEGKVQNVRPIALCGDTLGNLFVATQGGTVHRFKNTPDATTARLVLDLRTIVSDRKKANEQGLLGLALHPDFAKNGRFFVCYTSTDDEPCRTIVSQFEFPPNGQAHRIDPSSQKVLLTISQPFSNHNGGSLAFGPDGYLYVGLGDGGSQRDPLGNAQNLGTLLGSILRLDVDHSSSEKPYAIPADNPFVNTPGARGEIFAYGLRNVWQISFDRDTGQLWAADVGQDQWEEIDVIRSGGNYGWNHREGFAAFGNATASENANFLDPVWQYDRRLGRSITGGFVYRGSNIPELFGYYLYADYVLGRMWALKYDAKTGLVIKNMGIADGGLPVLAFGQDDAGEAYYMMEGTGGGTIFRLTPKK